MTPTIVVVDDEPGVLRFVARTLRARGYQVLEADSSTDALALARNYTGPIQLLLTDVVMPGGDGTSLWESFSEVRPETQVLFMSGLTTGMASFSSNFLRKPFGTHDLVSEVERVIG